MPKLVSLDEVIEFMERQCVGVDQNADTARWELIRRARAVEPAPVKNTELAAELRDMVRRGPCNLGDADAAVMLEAAEALGAAEPEKQS